MRQSESIAQIAPALVLAMGELEAAEKDRTNPAFKSRYATLAAVVEVSRPSLAKNGLAVLQFTNVDADGKAVTVTTRVLHKSAEWIEDDLTLPVANWTAQGIGSALTYAKRYGYCAILGVVADEDDDDGNTATRSQQSAPPAGFEDWLTDLTAASDSGTVALENAWKASSKAFKEYLTKTEQARWDGLKARAGRVQVPA